MEYISEWPPKREDKDEGDNENVDLRTADQELVLWIKRNKIRINFEGLKSKNPKTKINFAKSRPEVKLFFRNKLEEVLSAKELSKKSGKFHFVVASYRAALGEYSEAFDAINNALELYGIDANSVNSYPLEKYLDYIESLESEEKDALIFREKLRRQNLKFETVKASKTEVERRNYDTLSVEEFMEKYSGAGNPVVITGVPDIVSVPWTFDHIAEVAGHHKFVPKISDPHSSEWARLDPGDPQTVLQFINSQFKGQNEGYKSYLFDWSLPLFCPDLWREVRIPKYFRDNDYLKRTSPEALYRNSWPSLFVAPRGVVSELHIDAFGSHFWMALLVGRKKWTFFRPDRTHLLNPNYVDLDPVFEIPDFETFVEENKNILEPLEVILGPGEVLFVPGGSPHRVENLEDSIAISGNFVDESNIRSVERHLRINAICDPRSADLLREFKVYHWI